jgi:DNA-3-methyladenine glycosylase
MRKRRPAARRDEDLANGPGKLTLALAITRTHNGSDVTKGPIVVQEPATVEAFETGVSPRIGITHCADWPLRFFVRGNAFVSR